MRSNMIFKFGVALAAIVTLQATRIAAAADVAGYLTLTTDYVQRGVTQSDGEPAAQLGADISFKSGFFLGAWTSTLNIDSTPTRKRDLEVNLYGGYTYQLTEAWQVGAHAVAYRYPGQTGPFDYEYEEYAISASFDDRLWFEYIYAPETYDSGRSSRIIELYSEWPLNSQWSLGGGIGYFDSSNLAGRSYTYWQLGVTTSFTWGDLDLRYHDTDHWVPFISSADRTGARVALKLQIPF